MNPFGSFLIIHFEAGGHTQNLVWQKKGHESGLHHHGYDHRDWDGFTNRPHKEIHEGFQGNIEETYPTDYTKRPLPFEKDVENLREKICGYES